MSFTHFTSLNKVEVRHNDKLIHTSQLPDCFRDLTLYPSFHCKSREVASLAILNFWDKEEETSEPD